MQATIHVYEVRPRKDHRGVDLISDMLLSFPSRVFEFNKRNQLFIHTHNETLSVA
jgi:hypothetical protein